MRGSLTVFASSLTRWQHRARIGDFDVQSGETIRDAVLGYRTAGRLNRERSNAVLVVPWFSGTSRQTSRHVATGRLVDPSRYFVIIVDTLGNGVSSSPSNSRTQAGHGFPQFTMRDIVRSQHHLVSRTFGLQTLHAVVGISMGGMLAFEWAVAFPGFVRRVVSVVGSPQSQPDDVQRCQAGLERLRVAARVRVRDAIWRLKPRTAFYEYTMRPLDRVRQTQAMMSHDITREFGGSMSRAASAIRARLLVVGTPTDEEVNPGPGFELARLVGADVVKLDGRCGHQAPSCERERLWTAVSEFLARPDRAAPLTSIR